MDSRNLFIVIGSILLLLIIVFLLIQRRTGYFGRHVKWGKLLTIRNLRSRILTTLLLLIIYWSAANIPAPGIHREVITRVLSQDLETGFLFDILNLLSGGLLTKFSVLALGVQPYLTSQALVQMYMYLSPNFKRNYANDPYGIEEFMSRWSYLLTIPLGMVYSYWHINLLSTLDCGLGSSIVSRFGFSMGDWVFTTTTLISMTAGTMFVVWISKLISEFGIEKQGVNFILFSGIAVSLLDGMRQTLEQSQGWLKLAIFVIIIIVTIYIIVFLISGKRMIPVFYPGRRIGTRHSPPKGLIPLHVNLVGAGPMLRAQSILLFPALIAIIFRCSEKAWLRSTVDRILNFYNEGNVFFLLALCTIVIVFTYFSTEALFQQVQYAENLRRAGARVPGLKPGEETHNYMTRVIRRIALVPALFFGVLVIAPWLAIQFLGLNISFIAGENLFIISNTIQESKQTLEVELILRGYDDALLMR